MTVDEKIKEIKNPNSVGFKTTFSVSAENMIVIEEELHKYGARVTCAVKENNGNWLLSVEKVV